VINVARAGRELPLIFEMVASGALHITGINMLTKYLTKENHAELLEAAAGKTKRQIQELIAVRFPVPDAPTTIRKLPQTSIPAPRLLREPASVIGDKKDLFSGPARDAAPPTFAPETSAAKPQHPVPVPQPKPTITPTAPSRYKITFTADDELMQMIEDAQSLMRHQIPDGDIAKVLKRALPSIIEKLRKRKLGETNAPRPRASNTPKRPNTSRHIPNAVKREVTRQHGERCGFVSASGHRCEETSMLELHHIKPFALGGTHDPENLIWFCRAHNRHRAERDFGAEHITTKIAARKKVLAPELQSESAHLGSSPQKM